MKQIKPKEMKSAQIIYSNNKAHSIVATRAVTLQVDLDFVVNELYKFCLSIDKEFSIMLNKINGIKPTMEYVYLAGIRG